jgi:hypothetical protein
MMMIVMMVMITQAAKPSYRWKKGRSKTQDVKKKTTDQ